MRNMSFALTTKQYRERTKTVTRRDAWRFLKPGDRFMGVEKAMGLKRGEKIVKIEPSIVLSVREEPLLEITQEDVIKEGFPSWSSQQFIDFLCKENDCTPEKTLNRIEFEYEVFYRQAALQIFACEHLGTMDLAVNKIQSILELSRERSVLIFKEITRGTRYAKTKT